MENRSDELRLYDLILQNQDLHFVDTATGRFWNIGEIHQSVRIDDGQGLCFIYSDSKFRSVKVFLNFLDSRYTIVMLSAQLNEEFKGQLEQLYSPYYIYDPERTAISAYKSVAAAADITLFQRISPVAYYIHPDIRMLLSTSGSTGSPKLVKLSNKNLVSNTLAILDYLPVQPSDVVPLNVPVSFVYGLSVFNTNCLRASTIVCTGQDILRKEFWTDFKKYRFSTLSGVPYVYEMLYRIGFFKNDHPDLRYMTHSGGALSQPLTRLIAEYALQYDKLFYSQYGQTEAAGRMAYVPPADLLKKNGSIGFPTSIGRFEIDERTGELIYYGPNVSGGYAHCIEDLGSFEHTGRLYTGDIARQDEEGYYYITGRKKRFIKLLGIRVNLDDIEQILRNAIGGGTFICTGIEDNLLSVTHLDNTLDEAVILQVLRDKLSIHPKMVRITYLDNVPLTHNGKIDYQQVAAML